MNGTTSQLRADALREILFPCTWNRIDIHRAFLTYPRWARSLWFRFGLGPAVRALNRMVLEALGNETYDIAWIGKGVCLWPETIRQIRRLSAKMIYYTPDTSFISNQSRFFNATISLYDLIVTTKSLELPDFERRVPREQIALVTQCFDSRLHYPRCSYEEKRKEAVLIGLCEPDRMNCVEQLLSMGVPVRIGGQGWQRFVHRHSGNELLRFEGPEIFGDGYAEVLSRATIGLGLLTKRFPELHTTRTFEIPACGTVLATERNSETTRFFSEHEALFFDNYRDLGEKILALLDDTQGMQSVSEAGRKCVLAGPYSNENMLRQVLCKAGIDTADLPVSDPAALPASPPIN